MGRPSHLTLFAAKCIGRGGCMADSEGHPAEGAPDGHLPDRTRPGLPTEPSASSNKQAGRMLMGHEKRFHTRQMSDAVRLAEITSRRTQQ